MYDQWLTLTNLAIISVYTHTSRKLQVTVELLQNPNENPQEKNDQINKHWKLYRWNEITFDQVGACKSSWDIIIWRPQA